jgi:PAS domain S-box-containing protein
MGRVIGDMPIKRKLLMVTMVTTAAALLVSGLGFVVADSVLFRGYLRRDFSALARIIVDNSTAALAFDDPDAAAETLGALRARPHVIVACIFRENGALLARYTRAGSTDACPSPSVSEKMEFTDKHLLVSRAVVLNNRRLGTLVLLSDLDELFARRKLYAEMVLAVLLIATLVALLLSSLLQGVIATPISKLAQTATAISEKRDYSIRAPKLSGDELGVLVDGFNSMLAGIQSRDNDLTQALFAREHALTEVQTAREFLETTLASIGDAVISTDIEGRVILANRAARSILRWPDAELIGRPLDDVFRIVNEFTRETVESPVAKVLREGGVVGLANHTVLIAKDGSETPIADSGAPIRDESGNIHGTVLVFRDVSARRRADETGRLLASIVESSDDAIIGHDLNGTITSWNLGAQRIFGYTAEEMIGRQTSVLTALGHVDEMPEVFERIGRGERVDQYHALRRTQSGAVIYVSITVSPLHDALGRIVGASKIARDISSQVRATEQLAQLNAELRKSNERLTRSNEDLERFAFIASHDFQEPLRMVTIYSQLLVKSFQNITDERLGTYVENIVGGTTRMRELLADLLAYAEVGVRPEEPIVEAVDLDTMLTKVKQNLKASIDDTGATITADALPVLKVHEGYVIPLFQNLIANAIKYRSEQPPRIHISIEETDGLLRFTVADNGIGIDPEYHQKIFVAFKRLHGKQIPGTGIGLAICQRVVERYGGRIWVESAAGHGATFIFTLSAGLKGRKEDVDDRWRIQAQG